MKKPTLCVIFGGRSNEHEVSLRSAYCVLNNLDGEKYEIISIGITKDGQWLLFEGENEGLLNGKWQGDRTTPVTLDLSLGSIIVLTRVPYAIWVDLVLPVLHGEYGEDGRLQSVFELAGIKCAGCGAFSSHICMDKGLTKRIAKEIGVPVAKEYKSSEKIAYPVFVKPTMSGSSIGATLVENRDSLAKAIDEAKKYSPVMIEEYIEANEVEVGVISLQDRLLVSPVGMIKYSSRFYDYQTKYERDDNEYLIPAPIPLEISEKIREWARELFCALECDGFARFDFFVTKSERVVFNEVNTLPGFTSGSMFPRLFMNMGLSMGEVLDCIIDEGLGRLQIY